MKGFVYEAFTEWLRSAGCQVFCLTCLTLCDLRDIEQILVSHRVHTKIDGSHGFHSHLASGIIVETIYFSSLDS